MRLRKSMMVAVAGALAVSTGGAVSASAQEERPRTVVTVKMSVTPSKAGSAGRPQGVIVGGAVRVVSEPDFDPPIITGEDILFGEGFAYNGDRYPRCSKV